MYKKQEFCSFAYQPRGYQKQESCSITSQPRGPENGARKCPPEELIEEDKKKQKVTTLWSRGKAKIVVVVDLPKDKDTGPLSNQNGVSYHSQCNYKCIFSLFTQCKKCCDIKRHISLNKVGKYVVLPAKTVRCGCFSAVNKIIVTAQLSCGYSNSAELPRTKHSVTETIGTQTDTLLVSSDLSNSVLMNWDTDYPYDKFTPPKEYNLELINPEQNHVISRNQVEDCEHLSVLLNLTCLRRNPSG
jgi:hypothetical protein